MNNKDLAAIREAVREIEVALVNKNYKTIKGRVPEDQISKAISDYRDGKITLSPEFVYNKLDPIEVKNANPKKWFVDLDLWFGGTQTDLTASLWVEKTKEGKYLATLDDIHIL